MSDRVSPQKQAMDEKLAQVWEHYAAVPISSESTTVLSSGFTLSKEHLDALKPAQDAAFKRVFRSLGVA